MPTTTRISMNRYERGGRQWRGQAERVQCRARFSIFSYFSLHNFPTFSLDARAIANRLSTVRENEQRATQSEISSRLCSESIFG